MLIYSSNSANYFDYIASVYSRDELKAHPQYCKFLENPYIKDNMEIAIRYREAETGSYEEKKEFIECLLANGPELDADTIIHYRNIILNDPVYNEIASEVTTDMEAIDNIRVNVYNKNKETENCFKQPCNYLGKFSGLISPQIEWMNFANLDNFMSAFVSEKTAKVRTKTLSSGEKEWKATEEDSCVWGAFAKELQNKISPSLWSSMNRFNAHLQAQYTDFVDRAEKGGLLNKFFKSRWAGGDSKAIATAEKVSTNLRTNLYMRLGDCYRVFEHMRLYNPKDPKMNKTEPLPTNTSGAKTTGERATKPTTVGIEDVGNGKLTNNTPDVEVETE